MACNIERPTPQSLFNRIKQMFSTTVLGGSPVIPESNEWYVTAVNYAIYEEFYALSSQARQNQDPRTACCESLIDMAAVDGVYPRPATFAQGYVTLNGTPLTPLPAPLDFVIGDESFTTATVSAQPAALDANGKATIRVRALVAGEGGNSVAATGNLTTPIVGVDGEVVVCGGTFCNGAEAEACESFRARYLRRLQYNPRATNTWIMDKLLEWPCATRAIQRAGSCCSCSDTPGNCTDCGCADCGGKIEFYLMFDNSFECGIAPASVISEVEEWMFGEVQGYGLGQVEIGVCGRIVPVTGVKVDISIDIEDCASQAQRTLIRNQVAEYFSTLEPSKPLKTNAIMTIISNIIGSTVDAEVSATLVNALDGYGAAGFPFVAGVSKVFNGDCDLEPDCDYILCLNDININSTNSAVSGCP